MKSILRVLSCMSIAVIGSTSAAFTPASELQGMQPATLPSGLDAVFFSRPLVFEPNQGQCNSKVRFVARGARFDTFLTDTGATLVLRNGVTSPSSQVHIALVGARPGVKAVAFDRLPGTSNYFIDNEPSNHITDVPTFAQVKYESVYPGIDVVYHSARGEIEYDVVVAPKADPTRVKLAFDGVRKMSLSRDGDLVLQTRSNSVLLHKPFAYQEFGGTRKIVDARYVLGKGRHVGFQVGKYDTTQRLVIDPVLTMSTNLWGSGSERVAIDAADNIYVAGITTTSDLPVAGGYQPRLAGVQDAYVIKLNPSGTVVLYTTYLGVRRAHTYLDGITADNDGNAYLTGLTDSPSFPVTAGAYRTTGSQYVTKLSPAGNALAYSTFVEAGVASLAVDAAGSIYMTGTAAGIVTTTPGVFQPTKLGPSSAYVAKLNPTGTAMSYVSYLGGSASDEGKGIAVDAGGNAYVVGVARSTDFPTRNALRATLSGPSDAFVTKVNPSGTALVYSTYLGGAADERGYGVAVDATDHAVVVGWTKSLDFPVTAGVFQSTMAYPSSSISNAFVSKLDPSGNALVYSSYLGGKWCLTATVHSCFGFFGADDGIDAGTSVAIDAAGYVYVGGYATSAEFPQTDAIQGINPNGDILRLPFVAKVMPDGRRLVYSVTLGTRIQEATVNQVAVDRNGGVVAVGFANGLYPLTSRTLVGSGSTFVFKLDTGNFPTLVQSGNNPAGPGQPITLIATVLNPTPGGVVTFKDRSVTLGMGTVTSGIATITVTLAPGVHSITASNNADSKISPPLFQLVRGQ